MRRVVLLSLLMSLGGCAPETTSVSEGPRLVMAGPEAPHTYELYTLDNQSAIFSDITDNRIIFSFNESTCLREKCLQLYDAHAQKMECVEWIEFWDGTRYQCASVEKE